MKNETAPTFLFIFNYFLVCFVDTNIQHKTLLDTRTRGFWNFTYQEYSINRLLLIQKGYTIAEYFEA